MLRSSTFFPTPNLSPLCQADFTATALPLSNCWRGGRGVRIIVNCVR